MLFCSVRRELDGFRKVTLGKLGHVKSGPTSAESWSRDVNSDIQTLWSLKSQLQVATKRCLLLKEWVLTHFRLLEVPRRVFPTRFAFVLVTSSFCWLAVRGVVICKILKRLEFCSNILSALLECCYLLANFLLDAIGWINL